MARDSEIDLDEVIPWRPPTPSRAMVFDDDRRLMILAANAIGRNDALTPSQKVEFLVAMIMKPHHGCRS